MSFLNKLVFVSCAVAYLLTASLSLALDPDCGGVIESSAGYITYKLNKSMPMREVCVWTIVVPNETTIDLCLLHDGFAGLNIETLLVHAWNKSSTSYFETPEQYQLLPKDRSVHSFTGARLLQIVLATGWYPPGTGFQLSFQKGAENIEQGTRPTRATPSVQVYHQTGDSGRHIHPTPTSSGLEYVSFTVHPENGRRVDLTLETLVNNNPTNFSEQCYPTSLNYVVTEHAWSIDRRPERPVPPTVRFSECRSTTEATTIYSTRPLSVTYLHWNYYGVEEKLIFSWRMVE